MKPGTQLSGRTGTADCQQGIAGAPESEGNYRMRKMQRKGAVIDSPLALCSVLTARKAAGTDFSLILLRCWQ